jgi:hypothetical protein
MIQRTLVLFALAVCCSMAVLAQASDSTQQAADSAAAPSTEWSVTVLGSYGMHDVDFNSLPPIENCCLGFENSTGIGYGAQIGLSYPLTDNGLRLSSRIGYQLLPVGYSSFSTNPVYVQGTGTVNAVFKHALDLTLHTVPVNVSLEYALTDWLFLGVGPEAYYIASTSFHQTESLENPQGLTFENGSRTRIDTTSSLTSYNSIVFNAQGSLRVRLGKDIGSIRGIDLLLGYSYPLTAVFDPQTWQGAAGDPVRSYYINRYSISLLTAGLAVAL